MCSSVLTYAPLASIHLRSLHHSLHNVKLSSFADLKKATNMGQLLGLSTATPWISQVQLPAPRIDVSHKERPAQGLNGCDVLNSGAAWCAHYRRLRSQLILHLLLDCIIWWKRPNSLSSVWLKMRLKTPFGTLEKNWPLLGTTS